MRGGKSQSQAIIPNADKGQKNTRSLARSVTAVPSPVSRDFGRVLFGQRILQNLKTIVNAV